MHSKSMTSRDADQVLEALPNGEHTSLTPASAGPLARYRLTVRYVLTTKGRAAIADQKSPPVEA
jgi:hypothetical protein